MTNSDPGNKSDDDRKVIIIERDSGIGWAVAFIILAIAIGFGIIVFMDQQSMIEYKIERALQEMQEKSAREANNSVKDQKDVPEGGPKSTFPARAAGAPNVQL